MSNPTLHVVGLPHTATNKRYGCCAYTGKVLRFCQMMTERGHRVIHYGNEGSTVPCKHVEIFTEGERRDYCRSEWWYVTDEYYAASWDRTLPRWQEFNARAINAIRERAAPRDFVCVIGGHAQESLEQALLEQTTIEYGVGYEGIFSKWRAFESYAWMHYVYGMRKEGGQAFDAVIPNYFDVNDFPLNRGKRDSYLLFMSRMTRQKGYSVAVDIAKAAGRKLIIAGIGGDKVEASHVEHVGYADTEKRAELMQNAHALLVPTQYVEPFGGVAVEAMLCGTPVITTDWGAFTETVPDDPRVGYRCRTLKDFIVAVERASDVRPQSCRAWADRYSMQNVGAKYDTWLQRLQTLWAEGYYSR